MTLTPAALWLLLQAGGGAAGGVWTAAPAAPTVGDTVWVDRTVAVPVSWRVRAGKLDPTAEVEPLADPTVVQVADGWMVRYTVVAWTPGPQTLDLPPIWRLGPDGAADSLVGGTASFTVRSVIPDTLGRPQPKAAIDPLRPARRSPLPPLTALAVAAGVLGGGVRWRRRPPKEVAGQPHVPLEPEVPDSRWLAAGEPKAVAARAAQRLRAAVGHAVPGAHEALSTPECLAAVERLAPEAPLRALRDALTALDHVAFATAHGADVAALAARARALAAELVP